MKLARLPIAWILPTLGLIVFSCFIPFLFGETTERAILVDDTSPAWVTDDGHAPANALPEAGAEEVARELLKLQQQMGGSIVSRPAQHWASDRSTDAPTLPPNGELSPGDWPPSPPQPPVAACPPGISNTTAPRINNVASLSTSPVAMLRETVWQLETSAHWLETHDLYSQADALREVANQLRHDARDIQQKAQ